MIELKYVLPFLTLLLGGLVGNKLAIGRDRRKEFNEAAKPLYESLEKQRLTVESGEYPTSANQTDEKEFIHILRMCPMWKKNSCRKAIDTYMEAKIKCGGYDNTGSYNFIGQNF